MASTAPAGFEVPAPAVPARARRGKRRSIGPQAGRALELLGHSIEYLADEFIHENGSFSAANPQLEAIQLLMALNRQVYFECPEVPGWGQRIRSLLRPRSA